MIPSFTQFNPPPPPTTTTSSCMQQHYSSNPQPPMGDVIQELLSDENISNLTQSLNHINNTSYIPSYDNESSPSSYSTAPASPPNPSFLPNQLDEQIPILNCSTSHQQQQQTTFFQNDFNQQIYQQDHLDTGYQSTTSEQSIHDIKPRYQNPNMIPKAMPDGDQLIQIKMLSPVQPNKTLATHTDTEMPRWARNFNTLLKPPTKADEIFHIPNDNPFTFKWAYTRPHTHEALSEESFSNIAVESCTIFRMEDFEELTQTVHVSPTVSSHWIFLPCETFNHYTLGLLYLDVKFQRPNEEDRVPPVQSGRFIIDDRTGEMFVTGWFDQYMVVGWIESILGCERHRELLLYKAPPQGCRPTDLLVQNSFFERRSCSFCGNPCQGNLLSKACSIVNFKSPSFHPPGTSELNMDAYYRRFRGSYFGACIKTVHQKGQGLKKTIVPIFVDVKHTPGEEKQQIRAQLRLNVDYSYPQSLLRSMSKLFGLHPTGSAVLIHMFKANAPIRSDPTNVPLIEAKTEYIANRRRGRSKDNSPQSIKTEPHDALVPACRTRTRIDESKIKSEKARQKILNNRKSAARCNEIRKQRHLKTEKDLREMKAKKAELLQKRTELIRKNNQLKEQLEELRKNEGVETANQFLTEQLGDATPSFFLFHSDDNFLSIL